MRLRALLREPLIHFLIIGGLIFLAFDVTSPDGTTADPGEIVVGEREISRAVLGFEEVWRRPPTADEQSKLIEDLIREEILVREAIALGLDNGDTVVRRRLRQKMEFLIASSVRAEVPKEADLQAFFDENRQRYASPASLTFEHVFLGERPDEAVVANSLNLLNQGEDPKNIGERMLVAPRFDAASKQEVDGVLGIGFFDQLSALDTAVWAGPVRSGYGVHLVQIRPRPEPPAPAFSENRDRVLEDWQRDRSAVLLEDAYQRLREHYVVVDGSAE